MMDKLRLWAWYFALVVSAVLALISFYSGENFILVVLSAIIGFTLIYGICIASINIFEKTGIEREQIEPGNLLDIAVGQEDNLNFGGEKPEEGQIPASRAGQLNQEFAEGEPSVEKQAEIVRRMGWGD
ncbi:hypothetical protein HMPREF0322_04655 [Desulfitobacterium hafniense DP7]|uniref:Uncharacterized protein n=1 Tax=Desulfitobacterium hafniense DP7 TaxID=537010 RepID=G9XUJ6_DESHA|nr:hypothetical protein [Desulfitobacterium hafniense]EHL04568.1 hypothetical protein HMPREF0322_04655 [Desulfitobacterium hafniense DP7]